MLWIDPFFYASPSAIAARLYDWALNGTTEGSLWYNLWVTMQEALIGFFAGSIAGVFVGVGLGRNRFLSDILSVYIKAINSIPRVVEDSSQKPECRDGNQRSARTKPACGA